MGHFHNVSILLETANEYNYRSLEQMFYYGDPSELADDVAYIIIRLFSKFSRPEKLKIIEEFYQEISNHEFKEIFNGLKADE